MKLIGGQSITHSLVPKVTTGYLTILALTDKNKLISGFDVKYAKHKRYIPVRAGNILKAWVEVENFVKQYMK